MIGIIATIVYLLIGGYIATVRIDWSDYGPDWSDYLFVGISTVVISLMWPLVIVGWAAMRMQR